MRLLLALTLLAAPLAHAQILSVYGTYTPVHLSGAVTGSNSAGAATTTSYWSQGVGLGATYGVLPLGPIRLGLDVRGSIGGGTQKATTVLVGPKLSVHLPFVKLKPYVQASGGYLRNQTTLINSAFPTQSVDRNFAAYEVLGGVDYPVLPLIDLRLIEIGGGKGYLVGTDPGGTSYNVSLFTISTGVVIHF